VLSAWLQRKYKTVVQLMQANCWIPRADFIDPMAVSLSELPVLSGDGNESDVTLSNDDSGPKGKFSATVHGWVLC
jgi:hypothetical protein